MSAPTLLTGEQSVNQIIKLQNEIQAFNQRIADQTEAGKAERNDAELGVDEAGPRADAHFEAASALAAKRGVLQQALDALIFKKSQADRERADVAKKDFPRQQALAVQRHMQIADRVQKLADELGSACRELQESGSNIANLFGTEEARRLFRLAAITVRLKRACFKSFRSKPVSPQPSGHDPHRYFDYEPPYKGEAFYQSTLPDLEHEVLDNMPLDVFLTREDADAARARRDPGGRRLHVRPEGEVFRLVAGELRGVAAKSAAT